MNSSYKIFTAFGIAVELHITFILFFLLILLLVVGGYGITAGITAAVLIIFLFGTVLAHELSHCIVAMRSSIKVNKIILLPIGGMASIDIPEDPKLEFAMSFAGPLFNFVFALILMIIFAFAYPDIFADYMVDAGSDFIEMYIFNNHEVETDLLNISAIPNALGTLIWINLVLGIFNLFIPAFPLDGGRILRSLIAMAIDDYVLATKYAIRIGQLIFGTMFIIGFIRMWLLWMFIALFLFIAAPAELKIVKMRHYLRGHTAGDITRKNFVYVNESVPLIEFLKTIAVPEQSFYPVTNNERKMIGYVDLNDLENLDKTQVNDYTIKDLLRQDFGKIEVHAPAENILKLIDRDFIFVVEKINNNENVVGFITTDYLAKIARFQKYIKKYIAGN